MDYNILSNLQYCGEIVSQYRNLLLYAHLVPIAAAVLLSVFVFLRSRSLLTDILLSIVAAFLAWGALNLSIWLAYDRGSVLMATWAPIEIFGVLLYILSFYFAFVFIEKKDLPTWGKIAMFAPVLPLVLFSTTDINLLNYDLQECIATEGGAYNLYFRLVKAVFAVGTLLYVLFRYFTTKYIDIKKQIPVLGVGILALLYARFISGYISEQTGNYVYEIFGLFGMILFIGALTTLIVRYKTFNIKLLATQALVVIIAVLTAAQFFFTTGQIDLILTTATFVIFFVAAIFLVRSVKRVDEQAEILAITNTRLQEEEQFQSELLSVAAHQLKGPLANVVGYNQTVLDGDTGEVNEETKQAVHISLTTATSALTIVDQFLSVGRIKRGAMHYDMQDCDVRKLLEQVIFELKLMIEKKGLAYELSIPEDQNFMMVGDQSRIKQTIYVLIDNAIKYTPQGSLAIVLAREGDIIRFSVKDTGVGISAEDRKKLFTKFGRGPESHTVNASSSGLGLYLAKEFIVAHKGRIWVDSEGRGKGSQFIFEVPTTLRKSDTLNGKPDPFVGPRASVRG